MVAVKDMVDGGLMKRGRRAKAGFSCRAAGLALEFPGSEGGSWNTHVHWGQVD